MSDKLNGNFNDEAAKPFKIITFKDTEAPFMQGSEPAHKSTMNHLKKKLGLEDKDFMAGTIWTDKFGNNDYSYEFAVTVEAADKLAQKAFPKAILRIVTPGEEPSFRFAAPGPEPDLW